MAKAYPNHTFEELTRNVLRAKGQDTYNYRVTSDVSANSPGTWTDTIASGTQFMQAPNKELTDPKTFKLGYQTEPRTMKKCLDAAYLCAMLRHSALIGNPLVAPYSANQYSDQVKSIIFTQIARPELDHTKYNYYEDGAGWVLAGFIYKIIGAYEFIRVDCTLEQRVQFEQWIENVGVFNARNLHKGLGELFSRRLLGDYTPTKGQPAQVGQLVKTTKPSHTHVDAAGVKHNQLYIFGSYYNNRRFMQAALVSKIHCHFTYYGRPGPQLDFYHSSGKVKYYTTLDRHAKCYFKEWVDYGVFPDGMQSECDRGVAENPNKGINYAADNLDCAVMIAANFARLGDTECFDYESYEGLFSTKGGPKSLKLALTTYYKICNGELEYYFNSVAPANRYRLNQIQEGKNLWYVSDTRFIEANLYYNISMFKETYTRNPARYNTPYKSGTVNNLVGSIAGLPPFASVEQVRPAGNLFLFGQLEGIINPFSIEKKKQTTSFQEIADRVFGDAPFQLLAQAQSSLPLVFSIVSGPATVAGNVLTITGAGDVRVRVSQAGDDTYEAAPDEERTFTVAKAKQLVTFPPIPDKQLSVSAPFALGATSNVGGFPVTYDIISGVGSISGGVFTPQAVGTITILARQGGSDNYEAATAQRTFTVNPAPAPVTTNVLLGKTYRVSDNGTPVVSGAFTNGARDTGKEPTEFYATFAVDQLGGKTANKVVVRFINPISKFKFQYLDGVTWVDWLTATGNRLKERAFTFPDMLLDKDIRFTGIGKTPARNVDEIEVWAY